ncbi:hypothetical protein ACUXKH_000119 [Staphylococcus epidermidis]|uniref:hypothetical protein n=1 Tax=Staphylococcus TaxID=1279 RepID=UPI000A16EC94|nr:MULTISPECIES: hypothetical protein [Staphylococcus]ARJ30109.1 hypothetical protein B6N84_08930 [Staphylococcus lugdunensis]MCH8655694.1 hypothetical protein [Staphylococcus lugdunensis]MDS3947860.1 hypothetical protein [Staphylococcus epidermidis]
MPKSQQVLLAISLLLLLINIVLPVIGAITQIEAIQFSSPINKFIQLLFIIISSIFVFRQVKRKGF